MPRSASGVRQRIPRRFFGLPAGRARRRARPGRTPTAGRRSGGAVPRASAASPSVIPAKNRNFTSSAATGNSFASRLKASSSSRRSSSLASGRAGEPVEVDPVPSAASLQPISVPGVVDQHPPHRLGRGGEEVRLCRRSAGRRSAAGRPHAPRRWRRGCAVAFPRPSARPRVFRSSS